eukprot:TRINITY_DN74136_c0_g1_i1.p1 TRINITY_DN74136_c0_g1~~TRINITY_DN74136_c0_g1_i1.p1  ORF type:complete len:614 (+),score=111.54 TRINITY_DN74136_c0_g1_i1:134-1975(+)
MAEGSSQLGATVRESAFNRPNRMDRTRTLAGLVSISPEPPMPLERMSRGPQPSPPHQSIPTHVPVAARLAMAATVDSFGAISLEAAATRGNGPSLEPAWRVVQAAETRRAVMLDQRAGSTRIRRTLQVSNMLDKQKATMTTPGRESAERTSNPDSSSRREHVVPASVGAGTPTSPLAASMASTGPIVQISSWVGHDKTATSSSLSESRQGVDDLSPKSPELGPGNSAQAGQSKRRVARRQPQKADDDEEAKSGVFEVSGIQLQAQRRGATLAAADAAVSMAARAAAPAAADSPGKKVAAAIRGPHVPDPQELADALSIALGQLKGSADRRAWQHEDANGHTVGDGSQTSQDRPTRSRMLLPGESSSGYPSPSQGSPTAPLSPPPLSLTAPNSVPAEAAAVVSSKVSPDRKGDSSSSKVIKRACVAGSNDDSPATGPPGSAPGRRGSTTQRTPAAPAAAAMRRSRSMPAADKTEKSQKPERGSEKPEKSDKRKAASSSPGTKESTKESGQATIDKEGNKEGTKEAKEGTKEAGASGKTNSDKRESTKPAMPTTSLLPKSSPAAAAGAGSVAAKNRKKGGLPRKLVLPFSYGSDDPRYWHVETTEGRTCPQFLPT